MKNTFTHLFLFSILIAANNLYAQGVGIGTVAPDSSSALHIFSTDKGFLMPRMTSEQRDFIIMPAIGLMIYNTNTNDGQLNNGTPEAPNWIGIKGNGNATTIDTIITSIAATGDINTTSTINTLMPGMTL